MSDRAIVLVVNKEKILVDLLVRSLDGEDLAMFGAASVAEATRLFEQLLGFGNHLGLFSEMVDPGTGAALGNFPQAFTHIGLILAATECAHRLPPPKPQDR